MNVMGAIVRKQLRSENIADFWEELNKFILETHCKQSMLNHKKEVNRE